MTIEKKAESYATNRPCMDNDRYSFNIAKNSFIDGANWMSDKAIRIACDWLRNKFILSRVDEEKIGPHVLEFRNYLTKKLND